MKNLFAIGFALALLAAGCQHPTEVQVTPDEADPQLDVSSLAAEDSSSVDSSAVIPSESLRYAGLLLVNNVVFDGGTRWTKQSAAYSSVEVTDINRPLQYNGKIYGYYGFDLMPGLLRPVKINGLAMLPVAHRIKVPGLSIPFGHEYLRDLTGVYRPDTTYTWVATPDSVGRVEVSVKAPGDLSVISPAGGSTISRANNLKLRWTGQGDITIVMSTYNLLTKRTKPILKLHPLVNKGHATLDAAILKALDPREKFYVFTFILARQKESLIPTRNSGTLLALAQAASVYNSYVEIR